MSNLPAENTIPLPQIAVVKIEAELKAAKPDWAKIKLFVQQAGINPDAGGRLVVPSTYSAVVAVGVVLPAWVLVDAPGSKLRGMMDPTPQVAAASRPTPVASPAPTPAPTAAP